MKFDIDWQENYAAIWRPQKQYLRPVIHLDPIRLEDLLGITQQKTRVLENTQRFLRGMPANNVLLWGSRGTGKSSLVKALLNEFSEAGLRVIQIDKNDLNLLPEMVDEIRDLNYKFILFCDDISFEADDASYKALKSSIEGSIEMSPENILIYATSNRRHLLPEFMKDNLDAKLVGQEIHYSDAVEEKISLSERFGLWVGFYAMTMEQYCKIVEHMFDGENINTDNLRKEARDFALLRGAHSGRTAQQFFKHYFQRQES